MAIPPIPLFNPGEMLDSLVPDKKTRRKVSDILRQNGWPEAAIPTAVKIVWAESGGKATAQGQNSNGTMDTGFMQVNDIHAGKAGSPKEVKAFREWLKDPDNNARAGLAIYKERNGFSPWVVYTTGKYRRAPGGWDAVVDDKDKRTVTGEVAGAVGDIASPITEPLAALANIAKALLDPNTYFRVGKGALGGALLMTGVLGLAFIALKDPAKKAVKVAEAVTPVGKVGKVVKKL